MLKNFIYDDIPYPSYSFPETHPNQLAVSAKLLGLNPSNIQRCRVLELGCGDGSNLNWIAHTLPHSKFIGIDLSAKHIEMAKHAATQIGLRNTEFYAEDVMNISSEIFGKFDYIIAHGLFSWVPDFVREKILQLYQELLQSNGVGYISYNAYPGCHMRDLTRNMMRFHVGEIEEPFKKVDESRKFIELLSDSVKQESVYQQVIKEEFKHLVNRQSESIFHDDLSDSNQAFYFSDFIDEANKYGLQFLSEAQYYTSSLRRLPKNFQELLETFGNDIIKIEQYLDFQKMKRFRKTLLVHSEVAIERDIKATKIKEFYISSPVKCLSESPDLQSDKIEKFIDSDDHFFELNHPLTKAVLYHLSKIWSQTVNFDGLIENCSKLLDDNKEALSEDNIEATTQVLLTLFNDDFVKLYVYQPRIIDKITDKPKLSEFARFQARRGAIVTSLSGLNISIEDDFVLAAILLLNGERRKIQILTELRKNPKIRHMKNLELRLNNLLADILRIGLLVG